MAQTEKTNRQWILAERPVGEPTNKTLRLVESDIPIVGDGQMLLRTVSLSLDPYMRGRMSDAPSYSQPVALGAVMGGGTVARVVASKAKAFAAGDFVLSFSGWQDYAISDGIGVTNLGKAPTHPSWALGIMGMPGFTAWAGLTQIGTPMAGETLVVAAATGPVGATVGQIGKIMGCHVVGVAGGTEKCAYAVKELGFDSCIDRKAINFAEQLTEASPKGIDIYFENVGGKVFDAVVPLLNANARIPVCGLVSQYNATELPSGRDRLSWLMGQILRKKIKIQGFIIFDSFGHLYPEFAKEMEAWLKDKKIKSREEVIEGLEKAPKAFIGLLKGENFGKLVIKVAS